MQPIHKFFTMITLATGLSLITSAQAKPLPFIDISKMNIVNTAVITKPTVKKLTFVKYVSDYDLDLSYGGLEDSDIPSVIAFLNSHPDINSLNLAGNNKLTAAGMIQLASVKSLKALDLSRTFKDCPNGKCIGGLEAKDIAAFASNTSLTSLNIYMHSIGDDGAIALAKNTRLKELDVGCNNITDIGGVALAQNQSLQDLGLSSNEDIGSTTAIELSVNRTLRKLHMGQTNITDVGVIALATQSDLTDLVLHYTDVSDLGAAMLASSKTITSLFLSGTNISVNGAKSLAQSANLQRLGLGGDFFARPRPNDIGDEGAIALAHSKSIEWLDLSSQQITAVGAAELGKNSKIDNLYLSANYGIRDEGLDALLKRGRGYSALDISACSLTDKSAKNLGKIGAYRLYANSNFISDAGAAALAKSEYLYKVELMVNDIHDEGAYAFSYSIIQSLNVMFNRMSSVGTTLLLNTAWFESIEAGGENPYPSHNGDNKPRVNAMFKSATADKRFCYRTKDTVQCVDKRALLLSPQQQA